MNRLLLFLCLIYSAAFAQTLDGDVTGTCDCFTLTSGAGQKSSVIGASSLDLNSAFDFNFSVFLGTIDLWGGDGITFMLLQNSTGLGEEALGLGYATIPNSIAVEIDTWENTVAQIPTEIPEDHVALNINGSVNHDLVAPVAIPNIEDGAVHLFRITWDPVALNLEVFLDGISYFVYNGDIINAVFGGNPTVYFGITAATGGVFNEQRVCMYRNASFTRDLTNVCVGQTVTFTDNSTSDLNLITSYDWDFGDGNSSSLQNPQHSFSSPGVYPVELMITDASGCSDTEILNITVNPPLSLTMSSTDIGCFGDNDGTGATVATSGAPPYNYIWNDLSGTTAPNVTGLGPGVYTVNVTDGSGCPGSDSVTILEPTELLLVSAIPTNASCGLGNGTIIFNSSGGTLPHTFSIDGGTSFSLNPNFTGLNAGLYNLILRDNNNCEITTNVNVGLNSPLSINALTTTNVSCAAIPDGSITVSASMGTLPYQYSLDGITYQNSNILTGLSIGNYTVFVRDGTGCEITALAVLVNASVVQIDGIQTIDLSCNGGSNGEIEILASGGRPPYSFSVDAGVTTGGVNTFTGLSSGNYNIVVEDLDGCSTVSAVALGEPSMINIDAVVSSPVSCFGGTDGELNIIVSGGTPGYQYSIDGGGTFLPTNNFANLSARDYSIEIIDMNLCSVAVLDSVQEPAAIIIDNLNITDVTCNGVNDGEIEVIVSGGVAPYSYSIDGGFTFSLNRITTGLSAGNINVNVRDNNGCTAGSAGNITESDPLVVSLTKDTMICQTGTAILCPVVSGGNPPYNYSWNGLAGIACFNAAAAGDYEVVVEDVNGCFSMPSTEKVGVYPALKVISGPDTKICPGDEVPLSAEVTGGNGGPYSFEWNNAVDSIMLTGQFQFITAQSDMDFIVTVTDGCESPESTDSLTVSALPVPIISYTASSVNGCPPLRVDFENTTDLSVVNSFSWDFGNGSESTASKISQEYVTPGCYDIILALETLDGCAITDTSYNFICVLEDAIADFSYSPNELDLFNLEADFLNFSNNASTYLWNFGDGSISSEIDPTHTFPEKGATDYEVTLIATSADGCTDTSTQILRVEDIVLYYIPNAFTPTTNFVNQLFKPQFIPGFVPGLYQFKIFNRWGEIIFESSNIEEGWDGTYIGNIVDNGAYVWQLEFLENETDLKHRKLGHVIVLK